MIQKKNPVEGTQPIGGRVNAEWQKMLEGDSPVEKKAPALANMIAPISRRIMDMLLRQSDNKEGRDEIVRMVRENGSKLCRKDVEDLARALIGEKHDWLSSNYQKIRHCARMLGALSAMLRERPDLTGIANEIASDIEMNMKNNNLGWLFDYEDVAGISQGADALGRSDLWASLKENFAMHKWSAEEGTGTDFRKEHRQSLDDGIAAALDNGAPLPIIFDAISHEGGKYAIRCLRAISRLKQSGQEEIRNLLEQHLKTDLPNIGVTELESLSDVPQSMQSQLLWERIHASFEKRLRSESEESVDAVMGLLQYIPESRRGPFVKSAIESSAVPINEGIAALCAMPPEFQADELWDAARTEFAAMAKSEGSAWVKTVKKAIPRIPKERREGFLQAAGLGRKNSSETEAHGQPADVASTGKEAGGWRSWRIFRLFG